MDKKYQSTLEAKKNIKRYLITMLCCVPVLILIGILLEGKVNRGIRICIFVLIMIAILFVEEFIYSKLKTKKQNVEVKHEDVFK